MTRTSQQVLLAGMLGGLASGAVVAIWFLGFDLSEGRAFATPARLASLVMGRTFDAPSVALVMVYTMLHFGVFAALGGITAAVVNGLGVAPGLLMGAVFGVGVLNAVHYGGLLFTGNDLLTVLPVLHVLGANLAAGVTMMAVLHRALASAEPLGWAVLRRYPMLWDGVVTGVVGAATVAFWFFLVDIAAGRPFYTPAALGAALLLGVDRAGDVSVSPGIVGAYTVLHVLGFAVVGMALVWLAGRIEREPGFWLLSLMGFIVLEAMFIGVAGSLSSWILGAIGWVALGMGNLVAMGAMGGWLIRVRPGLRARIGGAVETRV